MTINPFTFTRVKLKRSLFGTLQLACPMCGERFSLKSTEVGNLDVTWNQDSANSAGLLTFEITAMIEHTCPTGTVVEAVMG